MIFLICTFKHTNLAKNLTNLAENLFDKLNSGGVSGFSFSQVCGATSRTEPSLLCLCLDFPINFIDNTITGNTGN